MPARIDKDPNTKMFIYCLTDPNSEEVRYIGFTNNIRTRYNRHLSDARVGNIGHRNNWIRLLLKNNVKPIIKIIEETNYRDVEEREKYWILYFGDSLTNMTDGGDGMLGYIHTEESKKLISDAKRGKISNRYHGTYFDKKSSKWKARVIINRNKVFGLRRWDTEEKAALEYDQAARIILGNDAILNFPSIEKDDSYTLPISGKRNSRCSSLFFGVSLDKRNGSYFSWILIEKRMFRIMTSKYEILCAKTYDIFVIFTGQEEKYNLNFPELREKYISYLKQYEILDIKQLRQVIKNFINEEGSN